MDDNNQKRIGRDSEYRIAALHEAVARGGQDGGVEGKFDVIATASEYYEWLTGVIGRAGPKAERNQKAKK